jgi:hypothetical protein
VARLDWWSAVRRGRPRCDAAAVRAGAGAAAAIPLYAEGIAVVFAALSVVAPPVGPIGLVLLLWLLIAGRARSEQKYAGLRILK